MMIRFAIIFLCLLMLSGCTALPAEERSFAVALGVDCPEGEWQTWARIPTYQSGGGYATVSGSGGSLQAALAALDHAAPMALDYGQLRLIILGEALIGSGLTNDAADFLCDNSDVRMDAWVCAADSSMQPLMDSLQPSMGARLSKFIDVLMLTRQEEGSILPLTIRDCCMMGPRQTPVLPLMHITGKDISVDGGIPLTLSGNAGSRLQSDEIQLLSLLSGKMKRGVIRAELQTVHLTAASSEIRLEGAHDEALVRFAMRIDAPKAQADATEAPFAVRIQTLLTHLSSQGCDVLGLGRQFASGAATAVAADAADWLAALQKLRWNVSVSVQPAA